MFAGTGTYQSYWGLNATHRRKPLLVSSHSRKSPIVRAVPSLPGVNTGATFRTRSEALPIVSSQEMYLMMLRLYQPV